MSKEAVCPSPSQRNMWAVPNAYISLCRRNMQVLSSDVPPEVWKIYTSFPRYVYLICSWKQSRQWVLSIHGDSFQDQSAPWIPNLVDNWNQQGAHVAPQLLPRGSYSALQWLSEGSWPPQKTPGRHFQSCLGDFRMLPGCDHKSCLWGPLRPFCCGLGHSQHYVGGGKSPRHCVPGARGRQQRGSSLLRESSSFGSPATVQFQNIACCGMGEEWSGAWGQGNSGGSGPLPHGNPLAGSATGLGVRRYSNPLIPSGRTYCIMKSALIELLH